MVAATAAGKRTLTVPETLERLRQTVIRCGLAAEAFPDSIRCLAEKLNALATAGRYRRLISDLLAANDRSNLEALVLEATFAYSFESRDRHLSYEVRQRSESATSIDFLRSVDPELQIYFEMRLLQRPAHIQRAIDDQLARHDRFAASLDGGGETREVLRLQNVLLSKVQDARGNPVKFAKVNPGDRNIVAVEVSQLILGAIDRADCVLATYGDPQVEEHERRNIFGLFQQAKPTYPEYIQAAGRRFFHFRNVVDGVLFLYRYPHRDPYDFQL